MAKMVLLASMLQLNATDLSANTASIALSVDVADEDVTTFGSGGWKEVLGGLKSASLKVKFKQDFAVGALDATLWPLLGTVVSFEVRAVNTARSTSNPGYTGNVLVKQWKPINGDVGKVAEVDVEFGVTGAVARQTA